jgi:GT2 family glycosyltransferase
MISINLTIYNKGFLIERVLSAIEKFSALPHEIAVVLDGCTDDSADKVFRFFRENNVRHKIAIADNVFETKANNINARNSSGDYIIIIQDDMIINEEGWDKRLIRPMEEFKDVVSVSANCAHDWAYNPKNKAEKLDYYPDNWWSDLLLPVGIVRKGETGRNEFTVRASSNRGPLAIRHSDFEKLGYFDEAFSPQQDDDHDFHMRAYEQLGRVTGLYWIDFISDVQWGATRNQGELPWLLRATHKNQKLMWSRHKDLILHPRDWEVRKV